jgi:hypothetical protein
MTGALLGLFMAFPVYLNAEETTQTNFSFFPAISGGISTDNYPLKSDLSLQNHLTDESVLSLSFPPSFQRNYDDQYDNLLDNGNIWLSTTPKGASSAVFVVEGFNLRYPGLDIRWKFKHQPQVGMMLSHDIFSRGLALQTGHGGQAYMKRTSFETLSITVDLTPPTVNPQFFIGAGYLYGQSTIIEGYYSPYSPYYYYYRYYEVSDRDKFHGLVPLAGLNIKLGEHLKLTTLWRLVGEAEHFKDLEGESLRKVNFSYGLGIDF